jgi:hypothetical protein
MVNSRISMISPLKIAGGCCISLMLSVFILLAVGTPATIGIAAALTLLCYVSIAGGTIFACYVVMSPDQDEPEMLKDLPEESSFNRREPDMNTYLLQEDSFQVESQIVPDAIEAV